MNSDRIEKSYQLAKEQYAEIGVDAEKAIEKMNEVVISLHCWQTDDVGGFEKPDSALSGGGIQATGNYPGKAKTIGQMRADLEKVMQLLPGKQRLNLHAIYGEFGGKLVDRDAIGIEQFQGWIDWAKAQGTGLDFNGTFFSHPKADSGFTLSSKDEGIRQFWVEHMKRCREIGAEMGKQLGTPCVHNTWIPDGSKDVPVDRNGYRSQLKKSLDEGFAKDFSKNI
jgi:L-rhamnose isomerase